METVFQQILGCNFHIFAGNSLHCTYHKQFLSILNPHLMSSDSLQSSISLLWLCSEELPKPYQYFHGIHTCKLLETVCLQESSKGVLTRKIWFYQWDSLDTLQDIFYELLKCHQVRVVFFFYLCTIFISG